MPTKEEFLVKFASQSGADIPGIESKQDGSTDININTQATKPTEVTTLNDAPAPPEVTTLNDATTGIESTTLQEDEELFIDSYSERTKIPVWQEPKFKGIIVALCVLPAVMAVGWIFKDGIPKPNLSTKSPNPIAVSQEPDEDKPKDATDGEWASYASTNGMRQEFANAAEDENTDARKKVQERINAQKSATVNPNTSSVRPARRTNNSTNDISEYRTVNRSYSPPATVRTTNTTPRDYVSPYRTVKRSYTPPIQKPTSHSVPTARASSPALSNPPKVVAPNNSQSSNSSQQQQNSPQERIAAIIAATSTGSNSESATVTSAPTGVSNEPATFASTAIPSRSRAIIPGVALPVNSPTPVAHLPSEAAVIDGQPQTLINRALLNNAMNH